MKCDFTIGGCVCACVKGVVLALHLPPSRGAVRDSLARALGWPRDAAAFAPVSSVTLPRTDRERLRSHVARPSPLPSSNTRANVAPASLHPPGNTTTHQLRPQRLSRRISVHVLCRYGLS